MADDVRADEASGSDQERRRRQGIWMFLTVYVLFLLAVIVLMAVRSHQLGYGWI